MPAPTTDPYWIHDLNPWIIRFSQDFGIRWYGLAYLVGLVAGWWLVRRWAMRGRLPVAPERIADLAFFAGIGMMIGGRLGFCLFYDPSLLVGFTSSPPFWEALAVHKGGMASHGGAFGLFLGTLFFCRKYKINLMVLADAAAAVIPIGVACGRVANFINGELWGRPTDVSWAVRFPDSATWTDQAGNLVRGMPHDLVAHTPAWSEFIIRNTVPRHPSPLYAAVLEGLLILAVVLPIHARHRRPGFSFGLVLTLYGIGRFVGEFFREPDKGQPGGPDGLGGTVPALLGFMSKGQALTIPIFLIGLGLIWWALRRPARPERYRLPTAPG